LIWCNRHHIRFFAQCLEWLVHSRIVKILLISIIIVLLVWISIYMHSTLTFADMRDMVAARLLSKQVFTFGQLHIVISILLCDDMLMWHMLSLERYM